jgi:hypothetical protein
MADNNEEKNIQIESEHELAEETDTPMERFFYHQRRALEETGKALEALLPPDFRKHGTEASKEFTKGFRVLVDAAIDELKKVSEREEEDAAVQADDSKDDDDNEPPSSTGKTKVKVKLD